MTVARLEGRRVDKCDLAVGKVCRVCRGVFGTIFIFSLLIVQCRILCPNKPKAFLNPWRILGFAKNISSIIK
jgi:hypothetical protein